MVTVGAVVRVGISLNAWPGPMTLRLALVMFSLSVTVVVPDVLEAKQKMVSPVPAEARV